MKPTLRLLSLTVSMLYLPVCAYGFPTENEQLEEMDFLQHIAEAFALIAHIDPTERITGWHQVHPAILEKLPLEMTEKFSFIPFEQRHHEALIHPQFGLNEPILISHQPVTQEDQLGRYAIVGSCHTEGDDTWVLDEFGLGFIEEELIQKMLKIAGIEIPEPVRYEINDADRKAYEENYPIPEAHLKGLSLFSGSSPLKTPMLPVRRMGEGSAPEAPNISRFPPLGMPMPPVQGIGREAPAPKEPDAPTNVPAVSPGNRGPSGDWTWQLALAVLVGFALGYGVKWMKWKRS